MHKCQHNHSNIDFNCLVTAELTRFLYYGSSWDPAKWAPMSSWRHRDFKQVLNFLLDFDNSKLYVFSGPNSKSCSSPILLFFCWKTQLDTKVSQWACSFLLGSPYYPDFSVIHRACSSSAAEWSLLFESSIETLASFLISILFLLTWQSFPAALTFSQMPSLRIHTNYYPSHWRLRNFQYAFALCLQPSSQWWLVCWASQQAGSCLILLSWENVPNIDNRDPYGCPSSLVHL